MILKKFIASALLISIGFNIAYTKAEAYRIPIGLLNNDNTNSTVSTTTNNQQQIPKKQQQQTENQVKETQKSYGSLPKGLPYYYEKDKNGHYIFTPEELWDNNPNRPPGPVLDFLTKPDLETGKLYLDWLNQRNEALSKSFLVLQELKDQEFAKHIQALKSKVSSELLIAYVSSDQQSANQLLELQKIKAIFPNLQIMVYPLGDPNVVLRMLYQYGFQSYVTRNNITENLAKIVSVSPSVYLFDKRTGNLIKAFAGGADAKEIIQSM
ncbi:MAG: hypothetical protein ACP5PO_09170 [Desulfurella sp.]|uniref:hypothetical protein n=1 Tax=Desulfurella sp. TaxID=1962857 RepID=UPI003D10FD18